MNKPRMMKRARHPVHSIAPVLFSFPVLKVKAIFIYMYIYIYKKKYTKSYGVLEPSLQD